ncbi:GNAT family N-acetyltransferase [Reichenbachiella carrageenanivorans]|uniref:GNAT family N-acetyltransferase n=1 Tax=Reichenbachiella carrageenanivorans TaxID=2979869 RepID=A0ABY6D4I3_9BACT|nr:GNAT family N-acetyltransferase [Reichenbachiella carrageenanivorans]UXX80028.1 GNAT family N-acetyltransferase [Reichenbachiella carrageenanivorans]
MVADRLIFLEGIPDTSTLKDLPIYYKPQYLRLIQPNVKGFYALLPNRRDIVMLLYFQCIENEAISLQEAPFGGIYFTQLAENRQINDFLQFISLQLSTIGITRLSIKIAPRCYGPSALPLDTIGMSSTKREINHHLPITSKSLTDQMTQMQRRRLKKGMAANFVFVQEAPDQLNKIYTFIQACRAQKKHAISVSLTKLKALSDALPSRYLMFSCYHQGQLIAATICVMVNDRVLYNFLPASLKTYNTYSPMVFLLNKIYEYGQQHYFEVLDLGTSMLDDKPNEKLITFKNRMGGVQTERSIYSREI